VPSVPPPDHCAGYLGAATSTTEIGLIRIPHVAKWFDTSNLTADSHFEQEETTFFSVTQYGSADGTYQPGSPSQPASATRSCWSTHPADRRSWCGRAA
jgi:hypothetical protein